MLRNREIQWLTLLFGVLFVATTWVCASFSGQAAIVCASGFLLAFLLFLLFTRWRYQRIAKLCDSLRDMAQGHFDLELRDNAEGELSILKSELYKQSIMLREQTQLLKQEKTILADALSDISHQMKTPLTSLSMMTDLLSDTRLPEYKRQEFLENVRIGHSRMEWLVLSLLKLARLDADAVEMKQESMCLYDFIIKAVQPMQIPMEVKNQTLIIQGDGQLQLVCDLNWTMEAVLNIVKNAVEHTGEGGEIAISFGKNPLHTYITIQDNGPGIDKKDLPHLFKRFYKGAHAVKESVGIGLAISLGIAQKQGGTIEVSSEKGKGTTMTIKFYESVK